MISRTIPRGAYKPPLGAKINLNHPFSKGLIISALLNEYGSMSRDSVVGHRIASLNLFTANGSTYRLGADGGAVNAPIWGSNVGGPCIIFNDQFNAINLGSAKGFGASAVTLCFIRRRTTLAVANRNLFNLGTAGTNSLISIACPYGDGKVYFAYRDYTQEYVISGLTFGVDLEKWVFVADQTRQTVWRNGIKVGENVAVLTIKAASTTDIFLGCTLALTTADLEEINFFQAVNIAWSDDMCKWWSQEPYAHFYSRPIISTAPLGPPSVNAGPDQSVNAFSIVTLAGSGSNGTFLWTQVSGPGIAIFNDDTDPVSQVAFTVSGVYVFRLTVSNALVSVSDDVTITIINAAPIVILDGPFTGLIGDSIVVTATTRTDDGLPIPPGDIINDWSISGPTPPQVVALTDTTAEWTFPGSGVYDVSLAVFDGEKTTTATTTVTILNDCVLPSDDPDLDDCE